MYPGRRILLLAVLQLLTRATPTFAQACSTLSRVVTRVDELQPFSSCATITGDLVVGQRDCSAVCSVTNFTALNTVQKLQGSLRIQCCDSLLDTDGFESLRIITGSLVVYYNQNLQNISGFSVLENVSSVEISENGNLQTISGFGNLNVITGYLQIDRNMALRVFDGFSNLQVLDGETLVLGHTLTVLYNPNLTTLSGLRDLSTISYGTVHIEGNTQLCYAGYPQWNVGSYPARPPEGDRGIDWRTKLNTSSVPSWQYDWNSRGFPTLLVQNNANYSSCVNASCHPSCQTGAGCLGPIDPTLCGTCLQSINTCSIGPAPALPSCDPTPIPWWPPTQLPYSAVFGVFFTFIAVIVLAVLGVLGFFGIKLYKRLRESQKGSLDINVSSSELGEFELVPQGDYRSAKKPALISKMTTSDMIAEPTAQGDGYSGRGMRKAPKLDTVVMSSYRQKSDSTSNLTEATDAGPSTSHTAKERATPSRPGKQAPTSPTSSQQSKTSPVVMASYKQKTLSEDSPAGKGSTPDKTKNDTSEIPMNFPRDQLKLLKEFGVGDFGKVHQAEAKRIVPGQKKSTVMVKQLKSGATREERETFLRPVEAMKVLRHPNVLSLLGVCSEEPTIMVILEYCALGNFKTYLLRKRPEATAMKQSGLMLRMATDMANGLLYLHSMSIAHNDFATRNCLVMGDNTVKLGDYGLTRQMFKEDYYSRDPKQRAWPIRWMAPEQIVVQGRSILNSKPASMTGNIWSFGIALWEVSTFAQWPYEELTNEEVIQTLKATGKCSLENPFRPREPLAPLFEVLQQCWQSAGERPSVGELLEKIQNMGGKRAAKKPTGVYLLSSSPPAEQQQKPQHQLKQEPTRQSGQPQEPTKRPSQGYKPRRPAPKRPGAEQGKARRDSQEPLISSSLSMEQEELFPEQSMSQDSVMSLPNPKFHPRKDMVQKWERTSSADPLISSSAEDIVRIEPIETIPEDAKEPEPTASQPTSKYSFKDDDDDDDDDDFGLEASPISFDLSGTADAYGHMDDNGDEDLDDSGDKDPDDFILEPPEDFSQSSLDKEAEESQSGGLTMEFTAEGNASEVFYNFEAIEEEDEDAESPLIARKVSPNPYPDFSHIGKRTKPGVGETRKKTTTGKGFKKATNPWLMQGNQFDSFDRRDALEEDDLPNVVYDEEVAALIW